MGLKDQRRDLIRRLATLRAHRKQVGKTRKQVRSRAAEQLDTNTAALQTAHDYIRVGRGGVLTHRYAKTRMAEGQRLRALVLRGEGDA